MATGDAAGGHHAHQRLSEVRRRFWESDRTLTALLILLVFTVFLADPLAEFGVVGHFVLGVIFTLLLVSGVLTIAKTRAAALVFGAVAVGSVVVHWVHIATRAPSFAQADLAGTLISTGMLAGIVLTQVFREGPITVYRIQGAVVVYLLIGLMWAMVYGLVYLQDPQSFSLLPVSGATFIPELQAGFVYFSFTTMTTLGYGDVTPVSLLARSFAMLEAIIGQLFPAILIARLVSMEIYYRQRRFEREQAALDREAPAREIERGHEPGPDQ